MFNIHNQRFIALFTIILSFFTTIGLAQKAGKIVGNLLDNQQALEFASLGISKMSDTTKVLHFTSSDSLGNFSFEKLSFGEYLLKISFVGYQPATQKILLSEEKPTYNLKNFTLKSDNILGEVTVTYRKKLIEKTSEGFIVNVASNIAQAGGTATDLLKSTPTVAVDADGAVTLRGKKPLVLINGRNSTLANTDQIPASSIESIEIVNNASAKYDANAQSGIINIRLKKNVQNGTNAALGLGAGLGSRGRVNSAFLINHKTSKWNTELGYDNRFAGRTKHITTQRTNLNFPDSYFLNQDRKDERFENLQNLKFNLDFSPNAKNNFTFEAIGNLEGQDNNEKLNSIIRKKDNTFNSENDRQSLEYLRAKVAEFDLSYSRKFENPKKSLTANLTTSIEQSRENTDILTQDLNEDLSNLGTLFLQKTHNYEDSKVSNAILDYAFPLFEKGEIETGYKGTFRNITNDYLAADKVGNDYIINTASTNIFKFKEQIHAFYALYHAFSGTEDNPKWKYEFGARAEQVNNDGQTNTGNTSVKNNYLKLFPTANLSYYRSNDEFFKLSYGKRINRPDLDEFNPFVDITDVLNPHSGNPNLKPEIIQAVELGYNKEWENTTFSTNVFYRHAQNTIRNFLQTQANGAVLRLPMNIGTADSYGLENIFTARPTTFYDLNMSVTFFQQKLNASNISADAVQSAFNWYGKLINNFAVGKKGKLQVIGNYNSATVTPQGSTIPLYNVDMGFQQKLGKGNAQLGLIAIDVFNTLKSGSSTYTTDFISKRSQKADTRAIMLTFAYTFNATFKEKLLENKFSREF
jgi:outer membrane receptor protein involved in Fe transport